VPIGAPPLCCLTEFTSGWLSSDMRFRFAAPLLVLTATALATIFGGVHGLVHDIQHRPIAGARITLHAVNSDWRRAATSNDLGEFQLEAVPAGVYEIEVSAPGFAGVRQTITITSGNVVHLHFPLTVAPVQQSIEVSAEAEPVGVATSTTASLVSRQQIALTPGADRANSLAMITDYVPSAVIVHDQLHVRGGHQVTWLIDGVPVPNTNIASNVGPQFDPKDINYLEVQRGGLSSEYGDRAYGVLNVIPRSGFERNRQAELVASYGSFHQTNDQLSFGDHNDRFAYYAAISGNRTDLGLETPVPQVLHDLGSGLSAFTSLIFNKTPNDQLRSTLSVRGDHYQVPNDPGQEAAGIRDVDNERDVFANFSWVHTTPRGVMFTLSPFYHFNSAHYQGSLDDHRRSNYAGGVVTLGLDRGRNNGRLGIEGFANHDSRALALTADSTTLAQSQAMWGSLTTFFAEDHFRAASWLSFNAGVRVAHFSGGVSETVADPRIGAAVQIPRLRWSLRAFYGRFYQAPPLFSVGGPVLNLAAAEGFGFLPLRGERDEQHEFGLTIPLRGWSFDLAAFRNRARNFFDHDALGNSNIFFPLTIARARIHGYEATVRSPQLARRAQLHLAFSRQWVEGFGGVTGGLTDFSPPEDAWFFLDHDQRDTLSLGGDLRLPWRTWTSATLNYGSGFLDGDGPSHLPPHTTFDLSVGKSFGESWSAQFAALNISNNRYLIDNSNTFGGIHYANPREVILELRYRFKY
jgi:TonB dependent receptor-like, beta-barrel/Carboxypeptidase regulatory-like domain/TonB-dependent Receptor Plug Domain